ncbi:C40 family peptidase [uncultured Flavobacterium sp.]|uniref:C40 family peptidase n=1 Tax=uncultured Flavobacterium sp. TaxID=165435 RepID=UPI0025CDA952|nr:C40 family peptidase [uncultured Flavobacterium sp.]
MITNEFVESKITKRKNLGKTYTYNTVLSEEDKKYFARKLDVSKEEILNEKLYNFIKSWEGTKYVYGGETRTGIDCSALMQYLYSYVYDKDLPRTAVEMSLDSRIELFKPHGKLREGDLVFFRITEEKIISHVGIYLKNNKFFAANQYGGVEIVSLKKGYWKKNFMAAGRFKQ